MSPIQSLRNLFFFCNPSFTACPSPLFHPSSVLSYIAFPLLWMGFRYSDLSCAARVIDKPPPFLTTHSSQPHKRPACMFTRTDTDTPIITSLQDNSTQRRLPRLHLGATHLSVCLLTTLLAGGGHSSHYAWYVSGDDGVHSEGWKVQAGDFLFWKAIDWRVLLQRAGSVSVRLTAEANGSW